MKRLWILIACVVLVAACGDDSGDSSNEGAGSAASTTEASSGGGGGDDAFCDALVPLIDIDPAATPTETDIELARAAQDVAPDELQGPFTVIIETVEIFSDPTAIATAEYDAEAFEAAQATLDEAAQADCNLEIGIFGAASSSSGSAAPEEYDSDDLRAAVESAVPGLDIRTVARGNENVTMQVPGLEDTPTAQRACAVAATYMDSIGFTSAQIRVTDGSDQELATCSPEG